MILPLYLQTLRPALKGWVLHRVKLSTDTHPDWTHLTRREYAQSRTVLNYLMKACRVPGSTGPGQSTVPVYTADCDVLGKGVGRGRKNKPETLT